MNTESVIQVADLRVDYGARTAVAGIRPDVRPGEVVALLGTNGAGKTTTMDVLEGYLRPTSGSVTVLGHDPYTERARIAPQIEILLQEAGFFGELTVAETVRAWPPRPPPPSRTRCAWSTWRTGPGRRSAGSPAASGAGSTSPFPSSAGPGCCSSTNPPPASTPSRAGRPGGSSRGWSTTA